jgi:hypothetical protein
LSTWKPDPKAFIFVNAIRSRIEELDMRGLAVKSFMGNTVAQSAHNSRMEESACCVVKNIGKPDAGKLHVRFDEGGQGETCSPLYPKPATFQKMTKVRQTPSRVN